MTRELGQCVVVLDRPKSPENVGTVLRSALALGADAVVVCGARWSLGRYPLHKLKTDTTGAAKHLAVWAHASLGGFLSEPGLASYKVVLVERVEPGPVTYLDEFEHPERCCYVFGPEDGSLSHEDFGAVQPEAIVEIRGWRAPAHPNHGCLNLATAASIVLYDRAAKVLDGRLGVWAQPGEDS